MPKSLENLGFGLEERLLRRLGPLFGVPAPRTLSDSSVHSKWLDSMEFTESSFTT